MKKKRAVTLKLSEEDITFLEAQGGKTRAVESLIMTAKKEPGREEKRGIEGTFWDSIITPDDHNLKETYCGIAETFISNGFHSGTADYFLPILMGQTGFDQKTLIKHMRKLGSAGYLRFQQLNFRPTLRLAESINRKDFSETLLAFQNFIKKEKKYVDFLDVEKKGDKKQ